MLCENEKLLFWFQEISFYAGQAAFAELFRSRFPKLYRFSLQYVENAEAAEEIVNGIFVTLWQYRNNLHAVKNPEGYLFISVKQQAINYIKRYSRVKVSSADDLPVQLADNSSPQGFSCST